MTNDTEFGNRVTLLRSKLGLKQTEVASDLKMSIRGYQRFEAGGLPSERYLQKLVIYFGCRREWLLTGEGAIYQADAADDLGILSTVQMDGGDFINVPKAIQKPGAGAGLVVQTEAMNGDTYAFRLDWLNRVTSSPKRVLLMDVVGDSMEGLIGDGDMILIDRGQRDIISGKIYLIGIGDEVLIKYLETRPGGEVLVKSENSRHEPFPAKLDDIRIIGRVIWTAREL